MAKHAPIPTGAQVRIVGQKKPSLAGRNGVVAMHLEGRKYRVELGERWRSVVKKNKRGQWVATPVLDEAELIEITYTYLLVTH